MLILVAAGLGWGAMKMAKPTTSTADQGGTFTVRRGDLIVTVTEGGSIRAHKSIQYKCQVERRGGEVTILNIVPGGTYITQEDVDQGKILVKLDSSALEENLTQEEMELSGDKQNATAEKEAYDIQVIRNESNIAQGKLDVRFALIDLQRYLGAELADRLVKDVNEAVDLAQHVAPFVKEVISDPNLLDGTAAGKQMKTSQDNIVQANASLATAQARLAGTERLHDANYVSDLDLQGDQLSVINSRFSKEDAEVDLNLFLRYDLAKEIETLLSNYIEMGRELERTYAQCRSELAQADARLSNAQQRYQQQSERVNELKEQIEYCTIRARAPGLVIYGSGDSGDAFRAMRGRGGGGGMIAEGEVVYEGQTIISMPDTAEMVADISVHETEVDKIRPGQPAEIVMDAFPDRILQGEVLEVAPLPDQQRGFLNPDLKVYKTQVSIDGTHDFLKTRMSCKVTVLVRELPDVIQVPIQVVANRRGRKVCYVVTPNGPAEREVQTGAFNDTFVQITEGLEAGETVLLNPPLFTEAGSSTMGGPDRERFGGRSASTEETGATPGDGNAGPAQGRRGQRSGRGQGTRPSGPSQTGGEPSGERMAGRPGMPGVSMELTEERIDGILRGLKQFDPAKAEEYEKLRQSDPEALKAKIREDMQKMMRRGGPGGQGPGGPMRPGGGREGRRNRSSEGAPADSQPQQRPGGQNDR
ncbi:MAG: HlyD family efflux transporter periplasmic adaptor subunit [Phycisphaerales bacterium]|nr:MAG: HlyD family efflux transporter periplasmic adaptor subunit [Phycisphaerales bacterium]